MSNSIFVRLGKETLVYGTSTVVARLLNFCLVPFYTYYLTTADYGVVASVFALVALLNVVFLFGMDQSYLRFASEAENKGEVFQHCFCGLFCYGSLLAVLMWLFGRPLSYAAGIGPDNLYLIHLAVAILFLDMLNMIPFTKLRLQRRAWYFAGVRTVSILVNVTANILFVAVLKKGVASIFWANIFASLASLLLLSPVLWEELRPGLCRFNAALQKQLLRFAWPFVPAGLASLLVSVIDKPILVQLAGLSEVGIYQANFKIGVFMMLIVSMFDQAWRPFFLAHAKDKDAKQIFARVLTLFSAFAVWVLLGLSFLMPDIIKSNLFGHFHLLAPQYWGGLNIIPLVLTGYFFYGLYINFMVGPVLTKRTRVLMWITLLGAAVSITVNLTLVPRIGILGAGWAVMCSYAVMAGALFAFTQKVYPLPYQYKKLMLIAVLALGMAAAVWFTPITWTVRQTLGLKIGLLCVYPLAAWLAIGGKLKLAKGEQKMNVCMIVTDGFEELEAIGTYAILRRGGVEVDVYSLKGAQATGRFGLTCCDLKPFAQFNDNGYRAIILPGGPQYKALEASAEVQQLLKDFDDTGRFVCAICAGPTILGRAGLLKGKKYTCFTAMNEDFGGTYCEDYAVTDGHIITGKSAAAAIDFGFAVLNAVAGEETAEKTKKEIYYKTCK